MIEDTSENRMAAAKQQGDRWVRSADNEPPVARNRFQE